MRIDELELKIKRAFEKTERRYQKAVVILEYLRVAAPRLDIERVSGECPFADGKIELFVQEFDQLPGDVLTPSEPLFLMASGTTQSIVPYSYYQFKPDHYERWMKTRIEPVWFKVEFPTNTTRVLAKWFHRLRNDMVILVEAQIKHHDFQLRSERRHVQGTFDPAKFERHWIYEVPEYMHGHDHIAWWSDGSGPKDRSYYRLAAHGWDGGE